MEWTVRHADIDPLWVCGSNLFRQLLDPIPYAGAQWCETALRLHLIRTAQHGRAIPPVDRASVRDDNPRARKKVALPVCSHRVLPLQQAGSGRRAAHILSPDRHLKDAQFVVFTAACQHVSIRRAALALVPTLLLLPSSGLTPAQPGIEWQPTQTYQQSGACVTA